MLADVRLQLDKELLVSLSLFGKGPIDVGSVHGGTRVGRRPVGELRRAVVIAMQRSERALVAHELVLHLFEQACLPGLLFLLVVRQLQDLVFKLLLFLSNLGLAELLLIDPALLEQVKLVDSHVHQDLDRMLNIVNNIEGVHEGEFLLFFVHHILAHGLDLLLRAYLDVEIQINNSLANNFTLSALKLLQIATYVVSIV